MVIAANRFADMLFCSKLWWLTSLSVVHVHDATTDRFLHAFAANQSPRSIPAVLLEPTEQSKQKAVKQENVKAESDNGSGDGNSPFDQSTENAVDQKYKEMESTNRANGKKATEDLDQIKNGGIHSGRAIGELTEAMRSLEIGTEEFAAARVEAAENFKKETNFFDKFRIGAIEKAVNDTTRFELDQQKAQAALIDAAQGALNSAGQWISDKRHVSDLSKVSSSLQEMYPGKTPAQVWRILDIDQDQKLTVNELFQALYNLGKNRLSEQEARKVATDTYAHLGRLLGSSDMQQSRNVFYHAFSSNEEGSIWLAPHVTPHSSEGAKEVTHTAVNLAGTIGPGQMEVTAHRQVNKTDHGKMDGESPGTVRATERKL